MRAAPLVVTASRMPEAPETTSATVQVFDREALRESPAATLDGALRAAPGFTLFRRSDSLTANPTAQGVSLRGLGPSGASRSLVLLDGVPLNDPFGGWVAWTKVPREDLNQVEIVPGGGATAWGNAALGGVVQVLPNPIGHSRPRPTVLLGDFGTRSIEAAAAEPIGDGSFALRGRIFSTNGFSLVAPERRGPIDVHAWSRHRWLQARWSTPVSANIELTASVRGYEEFRGNGTPYTHNGTREKFASVQLAGHPTPGCRWDGAAYAQDQSFASTFSSVNASRTAETPASDQFAVPATAAGIAWTGTWWHGGDAHTTGGFDLRAVRGETRENFSFSGGNFTRQRIAGGKQAFAGLFVLHDRLVLPHLRLTLGARIDGWQDTDGHRRESDRVTGALLRDDHYRRQDDTEFSPSAGLVWTPTDRWRVHANAQDAFRRPTLNELYRPFRQGSNVVETNPALRTEHVTSGELGAEWSFFKPEPATGTPAPASPGGTVTLQSFPPPVPFRKLTVGVTGFWNDFRDAVGNVTLARGPGTFPLFGTLPAGGTGRQRLNIDRTRVQGLEFSATWRPTSELSFNAAALLNDATVRRAAVAPKLVGNRVAQVPRRSMTIGASWLAPGNIKFTPRLRWIGRQFEDDENTLVLGEVLVVDVGLSRRIGQAIELFLNVENAGNARVETGRSADGVVNIGTPRLAVCGIRGTW